MTTKNKHLNTVATMLAEIVKSKKAPWTSRTRAAHELARVCGLEISDSVVAPVQ